MQLPMGLCGCQTRCRKHGMWHTCPICATALIYGHISAALGKLLQQTKQLQGEVRQQLLIVVQVAGYKVSLSLRYLRQARVIDALDCIRTGPCSYGK